VEEETLDPVPAGNEVRTVTMRRRSTFRAFRRDLALTWRTGGLAEAVLHRTLHRLYRRRKYVLFEHDLSGDVRAPLPPGVEIRFLEDRDWPSLTELITSSAVERFRRRAAQGRTCLVAWQNGRPIGHAWVSERIDIDVEPHPIPLPSDAVYLWDLYVDPADRSRGVGSALTTARLDHARERGFRRAWTMNAFGNLPSMTVTERASPRRVRLLGEVTLVWLLGRVRARHTVSGT
jgi:GNAT superfamily N-acetyltransferase